MTMRKLFNQYSIILLLAMMLPVSSFATTTDDAQLTQLLSGFNAMTANFMQTMYSGKNKVMQKSSGKMALQRPGKFRWQIVQPNPQLLIADGQFLWIYDMDLAQVTRQKLSAANANSPAYLLSGSVKALQKRFVISKMNKSGNAGVWFRLKPRAKSDLFQWIELHFVNNQLVGMQMTDSLGQLSAFTFTNIKINPPMAPTLFKFTAPKGVDVIKTQL